MLRMPDARRVLVVRFAIAAAHLMLLASACSTAPVGHPGRWSIPADIERAGAAVVRYDGAPAWDGGAHCAGTFSAGTEELARQLQREFPQIARVYGYECRPNTAIPGETSQHGTGRAIDLAIATRDGDADNEAGDAIANWLVANSARIGVQLVIWDRTIWFGDRTGAKAQPYLGPEPHIDHIHIEVTRAAAQRETPFFRER